MADETWKYVENQFDSATAGSYKRMKAIASGHRGHLLNPPPEVPARLLTRLDGALTPYLNKYHGWLDIVAQRKGAVLQYQRLLDQLSATDIEDLDVAIKGFYKRTTNEYGRLFPRGREPFQTGPDDDRVEAVATLKTRLAGFNNPAAAGVVAQIAAVLTPLEAARDGLQRLESGAELARIGLEPLRVALAKVLHANVGALLDVYFDNPAQVTAFFDLGLLREMGPAEEDPAPKPPVPVVPLPPATPG